MVLILWEIVIIKAKYLNSLASFCQLSVREMYKLTQKKN